MDIPAELARATSPLPEAIVQSIASEPAGHIVSQLSPDDRAKLLQLLGASIAQQGSGCLSAIAAGGTCRIFCGAGSLEYRERCLAAVVQTWCECRSHPIPPYPHTPAGAS